MINKKLFKSAFIITAVMLSLSICAGGCSKQAEPVMADATVEEPEPEESIESPDPAPSPNVEPTKENIEDIENEEEVPSEEEAEPDLGYTIIPMDEVTMYATTNCNLRGGPGTDYDKVGSLSYAQEIVCNGKVEDGDKEWLVLKTEDGSTQMVSAKLVSRTKPQPQQSTNTNNSGGNGTTTQPPASNGGSSGGQPSGGSDPGSAPIGGGMFSDLPVTGNYNDPNGSSLQLE